MGGRILAVLLVGTTGCAQLAGIDETSGLPPEVSLTFDRLSIGASAVRAPLDLTGQTASYFVADAAAVDGYTRVPAALIDLNVWSAPIYTGTPSVMFTLPDRPEPRLWALPNRDLIGILGIYEHPDPTPAPVDAMLSVTANLPSAYNGAETFELYSVGTWTRKALTPPPLLGDLVLTQPAYAYSTSASLVGRPLEKITPDDAHLVLRYDANTLTGALEATPFDQTGSDAIMGTMLDVPRDQTLDVVLDPIGTPERFAGSQPAMTTTAMNWAVRASPGHAFAAELGPPLNSGAINTLSQAPLAVTYGNPFLARDWASTFTFSATASRTYTVPNTAVDITLVAGIAQVLDLGVTAAGTPIDLPVGVPQTISIDGVALITDGLTVPTPVLAPVVTFTADRADNALYELVVFEIAPNMDMTAFTKAVVITLNSTEPSFTIPPELLATGKMYTLRATTFGGGFPTLPAGDLTNRSLPFSRAYYESGVFTVTP